MNRNLVVIGAILILVGTGTFIVSRDVAVMIVALFGLVAIVVSSFVRRLSPTTSAIVVLVFGLVLMVLGATAVPASVRLLFGQELPLPARIVAYSLQAIIGLVTATIGIRSYLRTRQKETL